MWVAERKPYGWFGWRRMRSRFMAIFQLFQENMWGSLAGALTKAPEARFPNDDENNAFFMIYIFQQPCGIMYGLTLCLSLAFIPFHMVAIFLFKTRASKVCSRAHIHMVQKRDHSWKERWRHFFSLSPISRWSFWYAKLVSLEIPFVFAFN